MAAKRPVATLEQVMGLIREGQSAARDRHEDLKIDFEEKHKENRDRRHALGNEIAAVEGRVTLIEGRVAIVETKLTSIVGDNSGVSGMLNEIKGNVQQLQSDMAIVKQVVQDTPQINKWVVGAAAIIAFLVFIVPLAVVIVIELLKLAKH